MQTAAAVGLLRNRTQTLCSWWHKDKEAQGERGEKMSYVIILLRADLKSNNKNKNLPPTKK